MSDNSLGKEVNKGNVLTGLVIVFILGIVIATFGAAYISRNPLVEIVPNDNPEVAGVSTENQNISDSNSIGNLIKNNPNLSTLVDSLNKAELMEELEGTNKYTLFALTNEALNDPIVHSLKILSDPNQYDELRETLNQHILNKVYTFDQLKKLRTVSPRDGDVLNIVIKDGEIYLNGKAKIITKDIVASNGVIHIIDRIIIPEDVL
jgi:transforming growth factor-beta-induced protein